MNKTEAETLARMLSEIKMNRIGLHDGIDAIFEEFPKIKASSPGWDALNIFDEFWLLLHDEIMSEHYPNWALLRDKSWKTLSQDLFDKKENICDAWILFVPEWPLEEKHLSYVIEDRELSKILDTDTWRDAVKEVEEDYECNLSIFNLTKEATQ